MRVTLADIATKIGVSKSTVSLALRGGPHISPELRDKIQRLAKQVKYAPDPFLTGLAAHRRSRSSAKYKGAIAWINHWSEPERLFQFREFQGYWRGASETAALFGYQIDNVRWELDCSPKRFERILLARGIDGVLIPPHQQILEWRDFDWSKFSVLRFGMSVQNPDSNQVTSDMFRAVVMAIRQIHKHGYRRIGFTVNKEFNERLGGTFLSAYLFSQSELELAPAIPPLETKLTVRDWNDLEREKDALRKWLKQYRPEAVLTADIELPDMIRELGYRVPQDLALAATSVLDIPLDAGIDQRAENIGRTAIEMLVKQINVGEHGEPKDPCRILVESRWQEGGSLPPRN